jgi:hypothetical protein
MLEALRVLLPTSSLKSETLGRLGTRCLLPCLESDLPYSLGTRYLSLRVEYGMTGDRVVMAAVSNVSC